MKEVAIIKPVVYISQANPSGVARNTTLTCKTQIGRSYFILTENFHMIEHSRLGEEQYKNEKMLQVHFDQSRREYRIEWDSETLPVPDKDDPNYSDYDRKRMMADSELNERKKASVFEFFGRHQQIKHATPLHNGHRPTTEDFELVMTTQQAKNAHLADRRRISVFNKVEEILQSGIQNLYNLALYYVPEVRENRLSVILQKLIGLRDGFLMKEPNTTDFLQNYDAESPAIITKIYCNRAQGLGLIRADQNGYYIHGNQHIGVGIDDVVVYMLRNEETFHNYIVPEVNRLSVMPKDDLKDYTGSTGLAEKIEISAGYRKTNEFKTVHNQAENAIAREAAKSLGITNPDKYREDNLKKEVKKVGEMKVQQEVIKAGPTSDLEKKISESKGDEGKLL